MHGAEAAFTFAPGEARERAFFIACSDDMLLRHGVAGPVKLVWRPALLAGVKLDPAFRIVAKDADRVVLPHEGRPH
ncbi:MAG: hypothetical protein J6T01_05195 [Kiritimatiellae bacterium]|nr:hypothetical protein [Kiritimatiellia bacterium]